MKNTRLCFGICLCMLVTTTIVFAGSKNTLIKATYQTAPILDPLSCNDSSSGIKMRHIYDVLKQFDVESTENFLFLLATRVSTLANGGMIEGVTLNTFNKPDNFLPTFSHIKDARGISSQGNNLGVKRLREESSVSEAPKKRREIYHRLQDFRKTDHVGVELSQLVMVSVYRKYIISLAPYAVFDDACELMSA
jgi:hypothetical protein